MTIMARLGGTYPVRIEAVAPLSLVRQNGIDRLTIEASSFATRAVAMTATLGASASCIRLLGWTTQGDGGGGLWIKAAAQPSHAMKFQTADGAWWELARGQFYDIRMFGVIVGPHGAAPADSTTALANMNGYDPGAVFIPPGIVKGNLVITNRIYLWGSGGTHEGLTDVIAISGGSAIMAAVTSTPVVDVRANSTTLENFHVYGGSGGGVKIGHVVSGVSCTTVSGSTTVTVPGGGMTAADVGKFIRIETSGGPAYRTIMTVPSATSITVDSSTGLLSETVTMSYGSVVTHVRLEDVSTNYGCQRRIVSHPQLLRMGLCGGALSGQRAEPRYGRQRRNRRRLQLRSDHGRLRPSHRRRFGPVPGHQVRARPAPLPDALVAWLVRIGHVCQQHMGRLYRRVNSR